MLVRGPSVRVAVISDIHSNLPALEAVLTDIGAHDPEQVWCLGDLVGYGAQPDECTKLVTEVVEVCLAGNHDLVVSGEIDVRYFAMSAGAAARWTMKVVNAATREFLAGLTPLGKSEGVGLYHASPRDPVWEYVLSVSQAGECLDVQQQRVCLIGHSHVACHFSRNGGDTTGQQALDGAEIDMAEGDWLVNPGSVGQPRDGDPRASYLMLDTASWTASFRRIEYPIDDAARAIIDAGLPRSLADRLYQGL
jgi:diadenosine tetraphosphatase ApaH/serine/threonine PP2A family protein phosphatase